MYALLYTIAVCEQFNGNLIRCKLNRKLIILFQMVFQWTCVQFAQARRFCSLQNLIFRQILVQELEIIHDRQWLIAGNALFSRQANIVFLMVDGRQTCMRNSVTEFTGHDFYFFVLIWEGKKTMWVITEMSCWSRAKPMVNELMRLPLQCWGLLWNFPCGNRTDCYQTSCFRSNWV